MPRDESRTGMHVHAVEMSVFMDVFLLVPIRDAIRIDPGRIKREKGVNQSVPFRRGNLGRVSANSISDGHGGTATGTVNVNVTAQ